MIGFNNTFFANIKKKANSIQKTSSFFCILRYWHCGGRWGVLHLGHLFILNLKNKYETHDY